MGPTDDGGKPALVADGKRVGWNGCEEDAIASMDKGAEGSHYGVSRDAH